MQSSQTKRNILFAAAEAFLARIDNITTDEFQLGGDRREREALRDALANMNEPGAWGAALDPNTGAIKAKP